MPCFYALGLVWNDLYSRLSIRETDNGYRTRFMDDCLCALGVSQAVGDSDMSASFFIDSRHFPTKELSVHRGISELVDGNIIVDHLMQDSILDEFFRQVVACVDAEGEVRIGPIAEEPFSMLDEYPRSCRGRA